MHIDRTGRHSQFWLGVVRKWQLQRDITIVEWRKAIGQTRLSRMHYHISTFLRQTLHFAVTECTDCMQHYVVSLATIYLSVTGERILNNISNNKTTIYKAQVISRVTTKAQKFIILQNLEAGGNRAGLARIVVWLFCGRPKNSSVQFYATLSIFLPCAQPQPLEIGYQ